MNRCHVCGDVAVNADAALCLACSGKADRGEIKYDPNTGWSGHYPAGLTTADHIAHDMRAGRFPKRSSIEVFIAEREEACVGHVASDADPKVCGRCGIHIDSLRPD